MSNVQSRNKRHSSRGKYNEPQIVEEGMQHILRCNLCEAKECSKYPVQGQGGKIPQGKIKMDRPHKNTHNATF